MASPLRNALLAYLAGLAVMVGTAAAQDLTPYSSDAPDPYLHAPGTAGWLKDCFQRQNYCCASHHNDLGCTSCTADLKFIFGSCRTFWSEPCPLGPSPYRYVPPQSTKPPPKFTGLLYRHCASCEQAAP